MHVGGAGPTGESASTSRPVTRPALRWTNGPTVATGATGPRACTKVGTGRGATRPSTSGSGVVPITRRGPTGTGVSASVGGGPERLFPRMSRRATARASRALPRSGRAERGESSGRLDVSGGRGRPMTQTFWGEDRRVGASERAGD